MSALGKRKGRDDETEQTKTHGATLFISNLPYTATSTDLQTLFSDIAPVRSAFVVTERGSGVSKGVGYVSFAIKEDASSALEQVSGKGLVLDGRSLRVTWPDSKYKRDDSDKVTEKEPKHRPAFRTHQAPSNSDPLAIRTAVISGLPSSIDSNSLWKKIRKYKGAEKVDWPLKNANGEEDSKAAHAIFSTPAFAQEAVNKLHAHVFKGSLVSVTLRKRLEGLAKTKRQSKVADALGIQKTTPSRSSRVIVRNLPFNITEQDLRAVFLPYGPIHSITIPTTESQEGAKPRTKGFAFVWMLSKKDAERAMEGCNGMKVRAGMADGIVSDKQKRKKQRREEKKARQVREGNVEGDSEQSEPEEEMAQERTIAVDWALSKDRWEEEKVKMEKDETHGSNKEDQIESGGDSDEEQLGVHEQDSGDSDLSDDGTDTADEEAMDIDDQQPIKPALPPPESGSTLFIRNVPYEATEDELRTLFRTFGPLRYARITIDPATGRTRGTGFACFWSKQDADKAIRQSEILRAETSGEEVMKKNPFKFSSILAPDPSSSIAQSLVLHGRTLDAIRAVTKDEAVKLREVGEKSRQKADKRNMYLLREGIILPNTPAAETLSTAEVEKRTMSYNARRKLLQSNPSLYISRTRLSIRQIPLFVTERSLRKLALHSIKEFNAEFRKGLRSGLTEDELVEHVPEPLARDEGEDKIDSGTGSSKKKKDFKKLSRIKQAKIVRQQDRVDIITGKGRSKGYGFLELDTHANALRVLRWANNNPNAISLFEEWRKGELEDFIKIEKNKNGEDKDQERLQRLEQELEKPGPRAAKAKGALIIEFSIENVQVVQRRATRQKNAEETTESRSPQARLSLTKAATTEGRPAKRPRTAHTTQDSSPIDSGAKSAKQKHSNPLGSIIGKKRKQRKLVKKGGL